MRAGASQIDITPSERVELSGFLARQQPSTGVHDPLYAKALFLDDEEGGKLLWIHVDVIGFDSNFCTSIRERLSTETGLSTDQVIVSATHTHSGPPTIRLNNCGEWRPDDERYQKDLVEYLFAAGLQALQSPLRVNLTYGFADCSINHDRRGFASAHVDHRCSVIGVQSLDGGYLAVLANYPCHPVALGGENREISGDLFAFASDFISSQFSGKPIVLMTNGACGNINPPRTGVDFLECKRIGDEIGLAATSALLTAVPLEGPIQSIASHFDLVSEPLSDAELEHRADTLRTEIVGWKNQWSDRALSSLSAWHDWMRGYPDGRRLIEMPLHVVRIGPVAIACIAAEVFSVMCDILRGSTSNSLFIVGYANGETGYLCPEPAYAEGGYEVASAFIYYNAAPVQKGEFERAARALSDMIRSVT